MKLGDRFTNWTVIGCLDVQSADGMKILCQCDCGEKRFVLKKYLKNGRSKSCGCRGIYVGGSIDGCTILSLFKKAKTNRYAKLICKHGVTFDSMILNGGIRAASCPCERSHVTNLKHGESPAHKRTPEYNAWRMMRQRCNDKNNKHYKDYGGRGISVCERWDSYENFLLDMGRRPPKHSIDRINNDGNYEPENCRWADAVTQNNNRRNVINARQRA